MIRSGVKETNILFQVNEKQDFNHLVTSQSSLYVTFREEMEDLKLRRKIHSVMSQYSSDVTMELHVIDTNAGKQLP